MKNNKINKIILIAFLIIVAWGTLAATDYWRTTHKFEKPIFAKILNKGGDDDGGSGRYTGIGYSIEIMGNFLPEEELKGVTHARFFIFGKQLKYAVRE